MDATADLVIGKQAEEALDLIDPGCRGGREVDVAAKLRSGVVPITSLVAARRAEIWINPEIDQGFGLSGTFGVAGFPSAEAYKVGSSYPYARVPRAFLRMGDRLAFTNGVVALAIAAAIVYAAFGGLTEPLIPLFAIGVFIAFTLAQAGMVAHWWRERDSGWRNIRPSRPSDSMRASSARRWSRSVQIACSCAFRYRGR